MKFRFISICCALVVFTVSVGARAVSLNDRKRFQKIERTIPADPAVTISTCLMSGNINVRGWDKDEVMARSHAAEVELKRKDATSQSGRATKLEVVVVDRAERQSARDKCQSFSDLELHVPRTASVRVQTRDGNISIADVGMAFAGTQNGDIDIARVSQAVEVGSVGGSISVRDSTGRTSVTSIGGGIEVVNVRPSGPADVFEAISVSGDLMLDRISHTQLNAKTVTGNVHMTGPLAQRGRYGFKTMSGDVTLTLPGDSSFSLNAKIAQDGEIVTDFPLTLLPESSAPSTPAPAETPAVVTPPQPPAPATAPASAPRASPDSSMVVVKVNPRIKKVEVEAPVAAPVYKLRRVNAVCGEGDATISVASFSGTLHLQKNN